MAGLGERAGAAGDDSFWTWRALMYRHLAAIGPDDLEAIAAQLYVEMLEAGYTAVAEFQYLHHDPDGRPYADLAEMTLRCLAAARRAGIGFTALPVFYARGGFGGRPPGDDQRRFVTAMDDFAVIVERLRSAVDPGEGAVGIAPHSLRAVSPADLGELVAAFAGRGPIHVHVAEQRQEVEDCLAWSGRRPVSWLLDHAPVDAGWCLIHCTHLDDAEVRGLAAAGAVAGLCPATEANLGDGFFRTADFLAAGGRVGVGSDSHVSVSPVEEIRWLEYGQRLLAGRRNVLAGGAERSTGRRLFAAALDGGARACGRPLGALAPGRRADLVVLDTRHPLLVARDGDEILDSWLFSGNTSSIRDVFVGGRHVVREGRHPAREKIRGRFEKTLEKLRRTA
jgi:formimidoylglutamate deiminase